MSKLAPHLRRLLLFSLILLAAAILFTTRHWPLVGDAVLMHYNAFLFDYGLTPYRQVVDINLPGALFFDWAVIHLLGPGSIAWRIADFSLLAAATAAMIVIARPFDWLAGLLGGITLAAIHVRDGVDQAGERDLILAVLLLIACACLLQSWRALQQRQALLYSVALGLAASAAALIKPTALLWTAPILLLHAIVLHRRRARPAANLTTTLTAFIAPIALTTLFLHHEHALTPLLAELHGIIAYHATIDRQPLSKLLAHPFPAAVLPIFALWLCVVSFNKSWPRAERLALLLSIAFGVLSFILQGKGFPYHHYPAEAFLLPVASIDALAALRRPGLPRLAAAALLLYAVFGIALPSTVKATHYDYRNRDLETLLTADLNSLGGPTLSGNVQCLDTYAGCIQTLYDLHLVQATGFLYDCYAFHQPQTPASLQYRADMLAAIQQSRPRVIVVTDQLCFGEPTGFAKLDRWPALNNWLTANYTLAAERRPTRDIAWWPHPKPPNAYRIYLIKPTSSPPSLMSQ